MTFPNHEFKLYSIRSGVAIAIIQRVGRWEGDGFMEYVREQVKIIHFRSIIKNDNK